MRIVCPFTPGGSQDRSRGGSASSSREQFGQSFVVDNRSGAGGSIAADNVAKSPPDGYSVLLGNIGSHALVPHLYAKPPYNAFTDLETACWIGTQPNLLCLPSRLPARHAAEADRRRQGRARQVFRTARRASAPRRRSTMELFKQKTGVDLTFISYRGASAAAADVLAGHMPMVHRQHRFADGPGERRQAEADRHAPAPSARRAAPDTPTFAEAGFPDLVVTSWSLWAVPARTPAAIKEKLRLGTEKALKEPDVIESMKLGGFEPGTMSVAEADAFIKTEYKRWGEVIRAAGIKPQ